MLTTNEKIHNIQQPLINAAVKRGKRKTIWAICGKDEPIIRAHFVAQGCYFQAMDPEDENCTKEYLCW